MSEQITYRSRAPIRHRLSVNESMYIRIDTPGESSPTAWLGGLGLPRMDTIMKMVLNAPAAPTDRNDTDDPCRQFAIINQAML